MDEKLDFTRFYFIITDPTSEVKFFQDSPTQLVKEGDQVELRCEGDGNPQPVKTYMHNNVRSLLFHFKCCWCCNLDGFITSVEIHNILKLE